MLWAVLQLSHATSWVLDRSGAARARTGSHMKSETCKMRIYSLSYPAKLSSFSKFYFIILFYCFDLFFKIRIMLELERDRKSFLFASSFFKWLGKLGQPKPETGIFF